MLILSLPTFFISYKVYGSLINQTLLLRDYNTNKYFTKLSQIDNMELDIPNVSVTTIPLQSIKARYYINNKQYDKALDVLESSSKANPYLFFTENFIRTSFELFNLFSNDF